MALTKTELKERIPFFLFIFSICLLSFFYGTAIIRYKIFPYKTLTRGLDQAEKFSSKPHYLHPIRYKHYGVTIYDSSKIMPGVTLLTSFWAKTDWTAGIQLINTKGKALHHWEVNAHEIWPESPHTDFARNTCNTKDTAIDGTYLFPNGDIIFNITGLGLIRMNSQGKVIWKLPYRTHHSISRDDNGNFWVPGLKWIEKFDKRLPIFIPKFTEETLLLISPDGEILKEISLLESLLRSDYKYLFWHYKLFSGDILHLNDVEALSNELADQYSMFESGDLLFSMRHLNSIAVCNQNGNIKWLFPGVFTYQHDPDFEANGWITVLDNRSNIDNESMIRSVNPASGEVRQLFPNKTIAQYESFKQHNEGNLFYTEIAGKHQKLRNGNRLITEACAGRVFEITPNGEIIWEWISQPYQNSYVPEVLEGSRYEISEKDVAMWEN
ncbi:hypothetical protein JW960_28460 [candidate division KSB1 bacterium]|nr:hypothetical protein [candidate division KSB1 bacterium]